MWNNPLIGLVPLSLVVIVLAIGSWIKSSKFAEVMVIAMNDNIAIEVKDVSASSCLKSL